MIRINWTRINEHLHANVGNAHLRITKTAGDEPQYAHLELLTSGGWVRIDTATGPAPITSAMEAADQIYLKPEVEDPWVELRPNVFYAHLDGVTPLSFVLAPDFIRALVYAPEVQILFEVKFDRNAPLSADDSDPRQLSKQEAIAKVKEVFGRLYPHRISPV